MAISSSLVAQRMADIIRKEATSLPKDKINEIGDLLIKIGEVLADREKTINALMEILVFAHKNQLLLSSTIS